MFVLRRSSVDRCSQDSFTITILQRNIYLMGTLVLELNETRIKCFPSTEEKILIQLQDRNHLRMYIDL